MGVSQERENCFELRTAFHLNLIQEKQAGVSLQRFPFARLSLFELPAIAPRSFPLVNFVQQTSPKIGFVGDRCNPHEGGEALGSMSQNRNPFLV